MSGMTAELQAINGNCKAHDDTLFPWKKWDVVFKKSYVCLFSFDLKTAVCRLEKEPSQN